VGLAAGWWFCAVAVVCGQTTNTTNNTGTNQNNQGVAPFAPAGVMISPEGLLRVKQFTDRTGELTRARIAEARSRLPGDLAKGSPLRKISLQRLEKAIAQQLAAGKGPTEEMKNLAGLTRLQYVFYYPETKDIVIAGPAEGYFTDFAGRPVGIVSGRAVVELQDLVAALRAFPPGGKATEVIAVSIDPTPEGLARLQRFLSSSASRVAAGNSVASIVEGMKRELGLHQVTITGVSPRTHFAQVLVEADYRMKLIGIGLEPPPVKMATYIDKASPAEGSRNALQRWFFVPNYYCVRVSEDDLAMELVGQGVKLIGEGELVAASGQRAAAAGQSKASALFCQAFTANYPQIAARSPVYAQLKNLIDLAIAAAFIQKQDYYTQAGWKMEVLGDERQLAIEVFEAPRSVETACNAVWKGSHLMTPVGGGVQVEPLRAVAPQSRLPDEKGTVKQAYQSVRLEDLPADRWWWD
jgi:hypothetical protein